MLHHMRRQEGSDGKVGETLVVSDFVNGSLSVVHNPELNSCRLTVDTHYPKPQPALLSACSDQAGNKRGIRLGCLPTRCIDALVGFDRRFQTIWPSDNLQLCSTGPFNLFVLT